MRMCLCNCGKEVNKNKYRETKFISGHNSKVKNGMLGKKHKEESKQNMSLNMKGRKAHNKGKNKNNYQPLKVVSDKLIKNYEENSDIKCGFKKGHTPHSKGKNKENYEPLKILSKKLTGKQAWNDGLTKEKDKRVKESGNKLSITLNDEEYKKTKGKIYTEKRRTILINKYISGELIPHNKGKTKDNYEPLKITSEKMTGRKQTEKTKDILKEQRLYKIFPLKDSSIEIKMQNELQNRGIKFIKHKPITNILHKYQCDIFIKPNIVIECDGDYWHKFPIGNEIDYIRTKEMEDKEYIVFRFWESEINKNVQLCVSEVQEYLDRSNNVYEFNKEEEK